MIRPYLLVFATVAGCRNVARNPPTAAPPPASAVSAAPSAVSLAPSASATVAPSVAVPPVPPVLADDAGDLLADLRFAPSGSLAIDWSETVEYAADGTYAGPAERCGSGDRCVGPIAVYPRDPEAVVSEDPHLDEFDPLSCGGCRATASLSTELKPLDCPGEVCGETVHTEFYDDAFTVLPEGHVYTGVYPLGGTGAARGWSQGFWVLLDAGTGTVSGRRLGAKGRFETWDQDVGAITVLDDGVLAFEGHRRLTIWASDETKKPGPVARYATGGDVAISRDGKKIAWFGGKDAQPLPARKRPRGSTLPPMTAVFLATLSDLFPNGRSPSPSGPAIPLDFAGVARGTRPAWVLPLPRRKGQAFPAAFVPVAAGVLAGR